MLLQRNVAALLRQSSPTPNVMQINLGNLCADSLLTSEGANNCVHRLQQQDQQGGGGGGGGGGDQKAAAKMRTFNAQECSKFMWGIERLKLLLKKNPKHAETVALVSKDLAMLTDAAMAERQLSFEFPAIKQGTESLEVKLCSILGGGRKLKNTGTASWEGQFVVAEWISRHRWLAAAPPATPALCASSSATLSYQQQLANWLPQQWRGVPGQEDGVGSEEKVDTRL